MYESTLLKMPSFRYGSNRPASETRLATSPAANAQAHRSAPSASPGPADRRRRMGRRLSHADSMRGAGSGPEGVTGRHEGQKVGVRKGFWFRISPDRI